MSLQATFFLYLLVVAATASTFQAQPVKECEYELVVRTGASRGPNEKLFVFLEVVGGGNINTTNLIKKWGDMGHGHTYFLPNSKDRFRSRSPCVNANFCAFGIKGKKGELKPHWIVTNITVTTRGEGFNRTKTIDFRSNEEIVSLNPIISEGECP